MSRVCYDRDVFGVARRPAQRTSQALRATLVGVALAVLGPLASARADEPPATPIETPAPARPARALRGVAVLAPGAADETLAAECKTFAREVYKTPALRPSIDEAAARTLCGGEPGEDAAAKRLAELRQSLALNAGTATGKLVAQALADELGVRALVLIGRDSAGLGVRVVRASLVAEKISVFVEGTRIDLAARGDPPAVPWGESARAVEVLIEDEGEGAPEAALAPLPALPDRAVLIAPLIGPRRDALLGARPTPQAPVAPKETPFYESPWFWVAVGSVAAVGLTVLIVSQATDVDEGTVTVKGMVLP